MFRHPAGEIESTIMTRVTLSEFTQSVDQITVDCLAYRGATLLLGRWTIGAAVGEMNFEGAPDFRPPKGATEHQRKDYRQAMVLTSLKPQFSFDAWTEARQELSDFLNEEHRLEQRGYTDQALRDGLAGWGEKALGTLGRDVQKDDGYTVEAQKAFDKLSQPDGSGFTESEVQAATFDLALVAQFNGMAAHERAAWLAMLGRPDGEIDLRTVVALVRVPQALTNLSEKDLGEIRSAYFARTWPQTAASVNVIYQVTSAAHDALRTAANVIGDRSGLGRDAVNNAAGSSEAAEWLQADFHHVLGNGAPTTLS